MREWKLFIVKQMKKMAMVITMAIIMTIFMTMILPKPGILAADTESTELMEPAEPAEPMESTETAESSEPAESTEPAEPIEIKILILPKFEIQDLSGDYPGEAQHYFEAYMKDSEVYEIDGTTGEGNLYVKDGIALFLTGMTKVQSALNTVMLLSDDRFDFSDAYVLSIGCAGSAAGYGVMGDVYVISAAVDFDIGHYADPRDMTEESDVTWFHDPQFDSISVIKLDPELTDQVYELVKDVKLETTENTRAYMRESFPGEAWADRDPMVLRGTAVTGDNYWKGWYDHVNALKKVEAYGCEDPFATSDMEDVAVLMALERFDMLDRCILIRDSVNMDVFMKGDSPESLWSSSSRIRPYADSDSERLDIFETAMENNFKVGEVIIEAILDGTIS